ncbi:Hypothetical predicted protein [Scomber scombrus]|uniref:Uncharacterized protein n=1 Tax=Scomber scombrus TaxID=13677 RepID=A0AAV1PSL8_SCOSC
MEEGKTNTWMVTKLLSSYIPPSIISYFLCLYVTLYLTITQSDGPSVHYIPKERRREGRKDGWTDR